MSHVGKSFPNLTVKAIDSLGDTFELNIFQKAIQEKKKIVLFWYPKDFTFVCPTEIHAFQDALPEFEKRNTLVIGASCDTAEVHFAWLNTAKKDGGIEGVTFPLISDSNRNLSQILDILDGQVNEDDYSLIGDNVSYRATYIIDETGLVVYEGIHHMPIGRNVNEIMRLIDAYTHVQTHGEVCPANWDEGKKAMSATRDGVSNYFSNN
ncbi:MAG: peroxiredoxin [Chitinophagaceae bacterium]